MFLQSEFSCYVWFLPARNINQDPFSQNKSMLSSSEVLVLLRFLLSIPNLLCASFSLVPIFLAGASHISFQFHERRGESTDHRKQKNCNSGNSSYLQTPPQLRWTHHGYLWAFHFDLDALKLFLLDSERQNEKTGKKASVPLEVRVCDQQWV